MLLQFCRFLASTGLQLSLVSALALGASPFVGCARPPESRRVIVLGLDGFDADVTDLLISEGKLPNLAKIRAEGAHGHLLSTRPMLSPILWTTIATGRNAIDHGIGHFVAVNAQTNTEVPVTSRMRRVRAIWNILSDAGKSVGVVGWWATWPAESVRGAIVSDHTAYHFLFEDGFADRKSQDRTGVVHPPELWTRLSSLVRTPSEVPLAELGRFAEVERADAGGPFRFDDDVSQLRWMLSSASSYASIGRTLWREHDPDLLMVYVEAPDSASHLFGHLFRAGALSGRLAEQQKRFGRTVEEMYAYADEIVGEYMGLMDRHTSLVVLSDHGFRLGELQADPTKAENLRRVSAHSHRENGILHMYGYGIRPGAEIQRAALVDITPTLLTMLGLPAAADMPGRVLTEALEPARPLERVATYEAGNAQAGDGAAGASAVDAAILERLQSLGYLDATSPASERNLAAMEFEAGRYPEAVAAFEEIIRRDPGDVAARIGLAGAHGAQGNLTEALRILEEAERLDPRRPEIWHNRAVIFERQGIDDDAIAAYARALSFAPDHGPSRAALRRLTGSGSMHIPADDAERGAHAMAEEAQRDARRGDYEAAWAKIQAAVRTAPGCSLAYHYKANIAYLRRDHEAAVAAMDQALRIDPNNEFYRVSIEQLKEAERQAHRDAER